jgi:hypothetical protein
MRYFEHLYGIRPHVVMLCPLGLTRIRSALP